jgi:hypothetical protein
MVPLKAVLTALNSVGSKAAKKVELKAALKAEKTVPLTVGLKECYLAALMEQCLVVQTALHLVGTMDGRSVVRMVDL